MKLRKPAMLGAVGLTVCAAGVILNVEVLAQLLTGDGEFSSPRIRAAIWVFDAVLVAAGLAVFFARRRRLGENLVLMLASLAIFAPLTLELFLRAGIAFGVGAVRDPALYAGWCDDEDYWKLRYRWRPEGTNVWEGGELRHDPELGWTMAEVASGPCAGCPRPVLLYGDSFAHGVWPTRVPQRLPQALARRLPGRRVVDYAVSGYGLDQSFLRFRATAGSYREPTVVLGIMALDLDRSLFAVRDAPKPYFRLRDGELTLAGVPVPRDVEAWHRRHPPSIRSYLLALAVRRVRVATGGYVESEIPYRREEKQRLNRAILEAFAAESRGLDRLVVLFYPPWQLRDPGWREGWLEAELERLGLPYVDTAGLLREAAATQGVEVDAFFHEPPNAHPNTLGTRLIARAITDRLRD